VQAEQAPPAVAAPRERHAAVIPHEEAMMPREKPREPSITARIKEAIRFLIEEKADVAAAAAHVGIAHFEFRRQLGRPHLRRHMLAER
jgi:hypothetical protein